jgi:CRP-like cAMP-binding protein
MNQHTSPEFAAMHSFFWDFTLEQRAVLAERAEAFEAAPDDLLTHEGKPAEAFYLINSGHVAIELHRPGLVPARIQSVGPGEAVGWSWLFPPYRWEFDARVIEAVKGVRYRAEWLREKCAADAGLAAVMYKKVAGMIAARLTSTRLQLLDLYQ